MTNDPSLLRRFDYAVTGPAEDIKLAAMLILTREDLPSGSSFAVGANAPEGQRMLLLSKTSMEYLVANSSAWADVF